MLEGVVTLSVDIQQFVVGFHDWFVGSTREVEGYVKEVNSFFVCLDRDFEAIRFAYIAHSLLDFLNLSLRGFAGR